MSATGSQVLSAATVAATMNPSYDYWDGREIHHVLAELSGWWSVTTQDGQVRVGKFNNFTGKQRAHEFEVHGFAIDFNTEARGYVTNVRLTKITDMTRVAVPKADPAEIAERLAERRRNR